jgi:hypothetical protein
MKYTAELSSGAMIYLPSSMKIGSGKQKLMGKGVGGLAERQTYRQHDDIISLLLLSRNKESMQIKK